MIDFIKSTFTLIVTTILSLMMVFCLGAAAGFWYKFAQLGFNMATQLMNNFL